jgi:membrane-associated phospholipid phosphatase
VLRKRSRHLAAAAFALSVLTIGLAPQRAGAAEDGRRKARVEWSARWPRFRVWEYVGSAVLGVGAFVVHYYDPPPAQPYWQGRNAFDDAFRGWLRVDTRDGRTLAGDVSNVLWLGGTVEPFVIDLPVVLLAHHQPGVAGQLLLMDLEATAVSSFVNNALLFETGRARPSYRGCLADPTYDKLCGTPGNNVSFPSGHVMSVATAAGLTCVHHRYLPLYGNDVADAGACVFMSLATLVTATARIMSDRHNASDVIVGGGLGFAIGYGLPWLLHYRTGAGPDEPAGADRRGIVLVPLGAPGTLGMGVVGVL